MSWMQPVYSDMAAEIGYDDSNQEMLVRWARSGKMSAYKGVPEDMAQECANAPSVGAFLNEFIKPNYPHRYV